MRFSIKSKVLPGSGLVPVYLSRFILAPIHSFHFELRSYSYLNIMNILTRALLFATAATALPDPSFAKRAFDLDFSDGQPSDGNGKGGPLLGMSTISLHHLSCYLSIEGC